jgi:hypothetical protein
MALDFLTMKSFKTRTICAVSPADGGMPPRSVPDTGRVDECPLNPIPDAKPAVEPNAVETIHYRANTGPRGILGFFQVFCSRCLRKSGFGSDGNRQQVTKKLGDGFKG